MNLSDNETSYSGQAIQSEARNRLYFFDHLRAFVILLVIILHASVTYMVFPPEWWYVIEPENSLAFTALVQVLDVPIMLVLFFIAGFFAYPTIERYGVSHFIKLKTKRLGLPWAFGVVFLAPIVTYLITVTRGIAKPYLVFWFTDFWGPFYQQSVYWFLGILLLIFVLFAIFYNAVPRWQHVAVQVERPTWRQFAIIYIVTTVWFLLVSTVIPVDTWSNALKLFTFQPARLLLYGSYFCLGIVADRKGWFRENGYKPALDKWLLIMFLAGSLYLAYSITWTDDTYLISLIIQAILFNSFCLSAVIGSVSLFQRYSNKPGRLWSSLGRNAYGIYYLHPIILYPTAYATLSLESPIFVEATLLVIFTTVVAWGMSMLILTRWPILQDIF